MTTITLTWLPSTDDVGVVNYKIYKSGVLIGTTTELTYTDSGLTPSTIYTYTIKAFDAAGNSSAASPNTVASTALDTVPPATVTGLSGKPDIYNVTLSWTASTDNVAVSQYKIMRDGQQVGTSSQTSFFDSGLSAATSYSYTVIALDAAGNASPSSTPLIQKTLAAPQSGADIWVNWQRPTERENGNVLTEPEIGGFELRYRDKSANTYTYVTLQPSVHTYSFPNTYTNYIFQVACFDTNGLYSNFVDVIAK